MFKEQLKLILKHNQFIMESNKHLMSAAGLDDRAYGQMSGFVKSTATVPKDKGSLIQGSVIQSKPSVVEGKVSIGEAKASLAEGKMSAAEADPITTIEGKRS